MSVPADWKMYNGEVFFPYGWVDESFSLPKDDADDIKNTLYLIDGIIGNLQFWSLVMAGIFFVVLLAMLYRGHLDRLALGHKWHAAGGADTELLSDWRAPFLAEQGRSEEGK
uniref:Uncharacterized protein n=1 Tax=Spumella elongata TaxID=89044 RepID=A0A7S3HNV8_9STRA